MTKKFIITIISFTAIFLVQLASSNEAEAGKQKLPKKVLDFTDRIVGCNHWLGEEPYDAERTKQINAAVASLRCSELSKDEQAILKKYGSNQEVVNAIAAAKDEYQ